MMQVPYFQNSVKASINSCQEFIVLYVFCILLNVLSVYLVLLVYLIYFRQNSVRFCVFLTGDISMFEFKSFLVVKIQNMTIEFYFYFFMNYRVNSHK